MPKKKTTQEEAQLEAVRQAQAQRKVCYCNYGCRGSACNCRRNGLVCTDCGCQDCSNRAKRQRIDDGAGSDDGDEQLHSSGTAPILQGLFDDERFMDCTLEVGDEGSVKAHRCLLAHCSEVFAERFGSSAKGDVVKLVGYSLASVKTMVRFLYTNRYTPGEFDAFDEVELLKLADEFALSGLKQHLLERLSFSSIGKENALDLALIVDRLAVPALKDVTKACARVIYANLNDISATDQWKAVKATRSVWLLELLEVGFHLPREE